MCKAIPYPPYICMHACIVHSPSHTPPDGNQGFSYGGTNIQSTRLMKQQSRRRCNTSQESSTGHEGEGAILAAVAQLPYSRRCSKIESRLGLVQSCDTLLVLSQAVFRMHGLKQQGQRQCRANLSEATHTFPPPPPMSVYVRITEEIWAVANLHQGPKSHNQS